MEVMEPTWSNLECKYDAEDQFGSDYSEWGLVLEPTAPGGTTAKLARGKRILRG